MAGGHSAANDDGEPSGTAGRPMLEVLRHQQLEGVLASVVRYYGGVKLGAGGLVRAYTDSVASALEQAVRLPLIRQQQLQCLAPYPLEGRLRRLLQTADAQLLAVEHGAAVLLSFSIAESQCAALITSLNEACHGQLQWPGAD
jgi:putative IMPACT (imprinted ancient) family translation regulator